MIRYGGSLSKRVLIPKGLRRCLSAPDIGTAQGDDAMLLRLTIGALAALTLAACQPQPDPSIGAGNPYPVSNYVCDQTRLAVRMLGSSASVSVDGAAAVDLPATGQSGTTFTNGRQTLTIEQGRAFWTVEPAKPVACTGG